MASDEGVAASIIGNTADSPLELRTDRLLEKLERDTVADLSVVTADGEELEVREIVDG